jgi:ATP sulfurylase
MHWAKLLASCGKKNLWHRLIRPRVLNRDHFHTGRHATGVGPHYSSYKTKFKKKFMHTIAPGVKSASFRAELVLVAEFVPLVLPGNRK